MGNVENVAIDDILGDSFITYALATIIDRAIPSITDGCKPVQRRILYAMHDMKLYPENEPAKVQRIAGDVSGKYHPHGDTSVADAIFRMGQDWVMRYPLIEPQGNFGSPDDPPAAPRYPEASLTAYGALMLGSDLDKSIIPFHETYDGRLEEPSYLPSLFPNLLCNGQNGIAVAMTSETVSHNLTEVCQAIKLVAKDATASINRIRKVMPGPDFSDGGYILGEEGIVDYFTTGTGTIYLQGKAEISQNGNKDTIIVTVLPYGVSPSSFINDVAKLKETKKNEDIDGVENLSDKHGMKIEITLKRGSNAQVVLNNLYKHTKLRVSISVINNFIDENGNPITCSIKSMLQSYINHRISIIVSRSQLEAEKIEKRLHILEGLLKALSKIDETLEIIKKAKDRDDARKKLIRQIQIDEIQANSILDMQLSRLTNLGMKDLNEENKNLTARLKELQNILNNKEEQINILCNEVDNMAREFGDDRRTVILSQKPDEIKIEDLIKNEKMVVVISKDGYAKRVNYDAYKTQSRGGKGVFTNEEEDSISEFFVANTHDELLIFTEQGRYYRINVLDIQQSTRQGKGVNIRKLINVDKDDVISAALIDRADENQKTRYITTCSKNGFVKRTNIEEYQGTRVSGATALKLDKDDVLKWAAITDGSYDLILSSKRGYSVRFLEKEVREVGKTSKGVIGMNIASNDELISFIACDTHKISEVLTISENGYGKRTDISEFRTTARKAKGVRSMSLDKNTGLLVSIIPVNPDSKLMVLTEKGKTIKIDLQTIRKSSRVTKGVKIIKLNEGDQVVNMTPIVNNDINTV